MENKEEWKVDRTGWDSGPWDNEPDKEIWRYKGLDCMVVRNQFGTWCGYVGVTEGHPWFGKSYCELDDPYPNVHGGLTYSDYCQGHICHPNDDGVPRTYWQGFDTGHAYDYAPGMSKFQYLDKEDKGLFRRRPDEVYRDLAYVKAETEKLADQALLVK